MTQPPQKLGSSARLPAGLGNSAVAARWALAKLALLALLALTAPRPATAATIHWDGGGGTTSWHTAANWTSDTIPSTNDVVYINGNLAVVVNGAVQVLSLNLTNSASLTVEGATASLLSTSGGSLPASSLVAVGGGRITLRGIALYRNERSNSEEIRAEGAGSVVELPDLTTIASPESWLYVRAISGGQVLLPQLQVAGDNMQFISDGHPAGGDPSLIAMPSLGVFTGLNTSAGFIASNSGQIHTPVLRSVSSGQINVTGAARVGTSALTNLTKAALTVSGQEMVLSNAIAINSSSLHVSANGRLALPRVSLYRTDGGSGTFHAEGTNSLLELPALTNVIADPQWLYVQARDGAQVRLPQLRTVGGYAQFDSQEHPTGAAASLIDLPVLVGLWGMGGAAGFFADNGGEIRTPVLTYIERAQVSITGSATVGTDALTNINRGDVYVTSRLLVLNNVKAIDETSLYVYAGGRLVLPGITAYRERESGGEAATWHATGVGTSLELPALTNLPAHPQWVYVQARNGAQVLLPQLRTASGFAEFSSQGHPTGAAASLIDLPVLVGLWGTGGGFIASDGGEIRTPVLTYIERAQISITASASVGTDALTNINRGDLYVTGRLLALNNVKTIDETSLYVYAGGRLVLPGITAYRERESGGEAATWYATGIGTSLELPALTNLPASPQWVYVQARDGAQVLLPQLRTASGYAEFSSQGHPTGVAASLIDLPLLVGLWGTGGGFIAGDGGEIRTPILKYIERAQVSITGSASVGTDALTNINRGDVYVTGRLLVLNNVKAIDETSLYVYASGRLVLPGITSYRQIVGESGTFYATAVGTSLELPALTNLSASRQWVYVQARNGAQILLPQLRTAGGLLEFDCKSNPSGIEQSLIDMPLLSRLTGLGLNNGLFASSEGIIDAGSLASNLTVSLATVSVLSDGVIFSSNLTLAATAVLSGNSDLFANVLNHGSIQPSTVGNPLKIAGNLAQSREGETRVAIVNDSWPVAHEQLRVAGVAQLDGALAPLLEGGYEPDVNSEFRVITWGSHVGEFYRFGDMRAGTGQEFFPLYGSGVLVLKAREAAGPTVVLVRPPSIAFGKLDSFEVTFSEMIDPDSFTAADIEITGPSSQSITSSPPVRLSSFLYRMDFEPQREPGGYRLELGPAITDFAGNAMPAKHVHLIDLEPDPQEVSIDSPREGEQFVELATIPITVYTADPAASQAWFYANGTLIGEGLYVPFSTIWTNVPAGTYALTAVAQNGGGILRTSPPVNVTVLANAKPVPVIMAPTNLAGVSGFSSLAIAASASDADGTVKLVEFMVDGTKIGQATNAPYSAVWTNVTLGFHALLAVATDNQNGRGTSAVVTVVVTNAPTSLVSTGAMWTYLDTGANQGTNWIGRPFDDRSWSNGVAQLGYGDGDEATPIRWGTNVNYRHITYYFRKAFVVPNPAALAGMTLSVLRDDGAAAYLNGVEVFRNNLPAGAAYNTPATTAVGGIDEVTYYPTSVSAALLVPGTNILAVEVHQAAQNSPDVSFDAQLAGLQTFTLVGDADGDGVTNWEEYLAGTDPFDKSSVLRIEAGAHTGSGQVLSFTAQAERAYTVQVTLSLRPASWQLLEQVPAQPTAHTVHIVDTNTVSGARFYRVVTLPQP